MFNCFKLVINSRVYCITPTREKAEFIVNLLVETGLVYEYKIEEDYISNIGF
jgi:hypothetical protein